MAFSKILPLSGKLALAAALALPMLPAHAGSLDQSHEAVWALAGKTPTVIYRQRGGVPACRAATALPMTAKVPGSLQARGERDCSAQIALRETATASRD